MLDGLRAKARLPYHTEPPAWIGGNGAAWDSLDVVVCKNGMVHLPTLVAGKPDLRPNPAVLYDHGAGLRVFGSTRRGPRHG